MADRLSNGKKIRMLTVIDEFTRMLLETVERRFNAYHTPQTIEMLTENGSAYTAKETQTFCRHPGLKPCFTPVASPQSNGVAEPFVKTFKRD